MEEQSSKTALAGFWDSAAEDYDRAYDATGQTGLLARQAAVVAMLGDRPGAVVDAGMGPGRLLVDLARRGWQVSGVDLAPEMVAAARARLPEAATRLLEGSIEQLPFSAESFDAAVATGVLEYVDFGADALGELARVLRPGGTAVVSVPNARSPREALNWALIYPLARRVKKIVRVGAPAPPRRPWPPAPKRFGQTLAQAGLRLEGHAYISPLLLPPPLDRLFPRASAHSGEWVRRRAPRLARLLATQVVYSARKPGGRGPSA